MKKYILIVACSVFLFSCKESSQPIDEPSVGVTQHADFVDERDGQVYRCVTIGNQTWMADNLKYRIEMGGLGGCFTYGEELVSVATVVVDNKLFAAAATKAVADGKIVPLQGQTLPFRQGMHHLGIGTHSGNIKGYRAFVSIEVII